MTRYKQARCHSCDMNIMVYEHDLSSHYYCEPCAWSKVGAYDNHTVVNS